jgi:exodeoxyribonuclease VII large subunit
MTQTTAGIRYLSVSELTSVIKGSLESNPLLNDVWIRGELSNVISHSSGHIYCTLKDEGALLQAAFFKHANRNLRFKPEEGMSVLVCGRVTVYEKRGNYQLIITDMILDGVGALQMRIDQLRRQLQQEGIFDSSRKKDLPVLPRRLGVVTSPTGAAFRDILKVALRRFPELEIVLAPAKVQETMPPQR